MIIRWGVETSHSQAHQGPAKPPGMAWKQRGMGLGGARHEMIWQSALNATTETLRTSHQVLEIDASATRLELEELLLRMLSGLGHECVDRVNRCMGAWNAYEHAGTPLSLSPR